jgi:hypothetical protein
MTFDGPEAEAPPPYMSPVPDTSFQVTGMGRACGVCVCVVCLVAFVRSLVWGLS